MSFSVVIVDDNQPFLEIASTVLVRGGVEVLGVASTAAEALERVTRLRPDAVLVDVHLGRESGLDLVRQIAGLDDAKRCPAILMSTHAEADLAALIEDVPASGFIAKIELSAAAVDEARLRARR